MKVALIYSFEDSNWFSCTLISKNLRLAYEKAYGIENIISINYSSKGQVSISDLKKLIDEKVEKLIFIDHQPTPMVFLDHLEQLEGELTSEREYIIHVYGDYPLFLGEWKHVHSMLKNKPLKYICASEKQKKMISKFIPQNELIFVSPFPVNKKSFYPKELELLDVEKEFDLGKEDRIILYTGRISLQKNVKEAIELFLKGISCGDIDRSFKFVIAGEFDLLGSMYLSYTQLQGEYFREISKIIDKYSSFKNHIVFLGNINNKRLVDLYNRAELFLSLSTYHDEDYGMSVAEALMCGTPCLLTNWAGYASFNISTKFVDFIPTKITKFGPEVDLETGYQKLVNKLKKEVQRDTLSELADGYLSIESCSKRLKEICGKEVGEFKTVSDLMIQLTHEQIIKGWEFFRLETNREFNSFYFKVYDVYSE